MRNLIAGFIVAFSSAVIGCASVRHPEPEETIHCLYQPSFEVPVMVRTSSHPLPNLQILTVHSQAGLDRFFEWSRHAEFNPPHSLENPPLGDGIAVEKIPVPAARWKSFQQEVAASSPMLVRDQDERTEDGMAILGEYRHAQFGRRTFRHHIYTEQHPLTRAIYRLAADLASDEASVVALEALHDYYEHSIKLKRLPGPPLTLRFFGGLTIDDREQLAKALKEVPADSAVLIELSDFHGIGTDLYAIFREFLARKGIVVWSSNWGQDCLDELGVTPSLIYQSRESAVEALKRLANTPNPPPNVGPPRVPRKSEEIPIPPRPTRVPRAEASDP